MAELTQGVLVDSRFRADETLSTDVGEASFLGTDEKTKSTVVLHQIGADELDQLKAAKGLDHAHAATVLDLVVEADGTGVLVVEHVPGETLADRLEHVGKKTPVEAVRFALRVADVLSSLHGAGGSHGAIHLRSVVMEPDGDRAGPVLTYGPPRRTKAPHRSPERGDAGPPSEADDAWAASVVLYEMLVGSLPPAGGVETLEQVEEAGIEDEHLRQILLHGLSADVAQRNDNITPFKRELARWFVDHAGDEGVPAGGGSSAPSKPPPLPPGASSTPPSANPMAMASSTRPPPQKSSKGLLIGLAVGGIVFGLVAAYIFVPTDADVVEIERHAEPAPEPSAKEIDLSEVSVMGQKETTNCVSAQLPEGTFKKEQDLEWVCEVADPRVGGEKLKIEVVKGAGGTVTEASGIYAKLGWYDMAVFSVAYTACCSEAKKIELPAPAEGCDKMDEALVKLSIAVSDSADISESASAFEKVVQCELDKSRASLYRRPTKIDATSGEAFKDLVEKAKP